MEAITDAFLGVESVTSDVILFLACLASLAVARYVFDLHPRSVIKTAGAAIAGHKMIHGAKATQFSETTFKFFFHTFTACWALVLVWGKPWFYNTQLCFAGHPHLDYTWGMRLFYLFQTAYAAQAILMHFFEPARKDFMQMFLHHIVTLLLLSISWCNYVWRLGALVLLIHDISDVPLLAAKMFRYLNWTMMTNVMFALLAVEWIILRCYIFPRYMAYVCIWTGANVVAPGYHTACVVLGALLWVLWGLHVYWYSLIIKVLWSTLVKKDKGVEDIRSESEHSGSESEGHAVPPHKVKKVVKKNN